MWWLLAREVLRFRGTLTRDSKWDVMVDLFFYRDPEEAEKEEAAAKEAMPAPKEIQYHEGDNATEDATWANDDHVVAPVPISSAPAAAEDWNEEETVGNNTWGGAGSTF